MAFQSTMKMELTVTEPITAGVDLAAAPVVTHNGLNTPATGLIRTATTTIKAQKVASKKNQALTAGAFTLDLTSLADVNGAALSFATYRVNQILITCPTTNAGSMTFTTGGSNGYALDGTGWSWTLAPGESRLVDKYGSAPVVSSTVKTIGVSGTGTDQFSYEIVAG